MGAKAEARQKKRLERLLEVAADLPEIEISEGQHRAFRIRKKNFAYYLDDHHGDGIVALCCKSTFDEQSTLVELDPQSFYIPAYVGAKGWVAIRLDLPRVNWHQVTELLFNAYRAQAPRRLAAQV
jgi:hypothetical protein